MKKPKVLLAMSGGVDSSVAALLLKNRGFQIIGAFMKNYSDSKNSVGECVWRGEREMAIKIASKLNIPLITLDFEKEYKKYVVEEMFRDYNLGLTPNPDIVCNEKIKFPLMLKAMKTLGCNFLATGHYARIKSVNAKNMEISTRFSGAGGREAKKRNGKKFELLRAADETKDQSYFLYRLKQDELKHLMFPIGDFTKKQIREIALKNHFPNYDKKSTVGICFIGKLNLKKFLQKRIKSKKGKILSPEGKIIGEHDGVYYYTIGQRIGLRFGIEVSKKDDDKKNMRRWYVARKDVKKDIIVAAPEGHPLNFRKEIFIKNPHWINLDFFAELKNGYQRGGGWEKKNIIQKKILARIRQVGELLPCRFSFKKNKPFVVLNKAITGVSEGQAIVLYKGKKVLGGGEIRFK